jgi:hypothetical protein
MQDRPSAGELLATIGEFLDEDILPTVQGALRYKTLVAANLLKILQRELAAGDAPERDERDRLRILLGHATAPAGRDDSGGRRDDSGALADEVLRLNTELQDRLLASELPDRAFLVAARESLEASVLAKLAVDKPGYDAYDMAVEVA